jgi:hypothetical protein
MVEYACQQDKDILVFTACLDNSLKNWIGRRHVWKFWIVFIGVVPQSLNSPGIAMEPAHWHIQRLGNGSHDGQG